MKSANCATWNSERVELLQRHFDAGLSCSQIARAIGVTRNAVIGKMNRLGLSRPKEVIARQLERSRAAKLAQPKAAKAWRSKVPRRSILTRQDMPKAAFGGPPSNLEHVPIDSMRRCTLLELRDGNCRWPISIPGVNGFCFCGNPRIEGLSYCPDHARIAYRAAGHRRSAGA